jgi:hypothetical protein
MPSLTLSPLHLLQTFTPSTHSHTFASSTPSHPHTFHTRPLYQPGVKTFHVVECNKNLSDSASEPAISLVVLIVHQPPLPVGEPPSRCPANGKKGQSNHTRSRSRSSLARPPGGSVAPHFQHVNKHQASNSPGSPPLPLISSPPAAPASAPAVLLGPFFHFIPPYILAYIPTNERKKLQRNPVEGFRNTRSERSGPRQISR